MVLLSIVEGFHLLFTKQNPLLYLFLKRYSAEIFLENFGELNHFQRLRNQSDMMQMMKSLELINYASACLIYFCKNFPAITFCAGDLFADRFPVMSELHLLNNLGTPYAYL